jgi:hypothetical protein
VEIVIGEFTISLMTSEEFWICKQDGEGMSVPEKNLEALLAKFFEENM